MATLSLSKSVEGSYAGSNMFFPALSRAELLDLMLVLLEGRSRDLELRDSLERFSQLYCILKSPLKRKFIEI